MKALLSWVASIIAAVLLTFLSSEVEFSGSGIDQAVGTATNYGLPIPFKQCAPGWSTCRYSTFFWIDVFLILVLIRVCLRVMTRVSKGTSY